MDVDATEALIKVGCDVNALFTDGLNILMEIPQTVGNDVKARKDMVTLMQMVIEAGASVDWDSSKNNPLTAALAHGNPALLRELLLVNCPTKMVRKGTLLSDLADRDDAIWHMTSWTTNKPEFDFVEYLFLDCCCSPEDKDIQELFYDACNCNCREFGERPPLSLVRLCRVALRSSLPRGRSFQSAVDQLPLPSLLKDFVALRDI